MCYDICLCFSSSTIDITTHPPTISPAAPLPHTLLSVDDMKVGGSNKRKKESEPNEVDFYRLGKELQNRTGSSVGAFTTEDRRFREHFGCGAAVALIIWNLMTQYNVLPPEAMIIHFLWALHFMKVYPKQDAGCSSAGGSSGAIDPKTWRKYFWPFIYAMSSLEQHVVRSRHSIFICFRLQSYPLLLLLKRYYIPLQIDFEARKKNLPYYNDCLLSVDGTDFRIPNHGPQFASHKYKGKSALRYEVALDILKGELAWHHGPFPAGAWPDISIFRHALKYHIDENERVEADDGYIGEAPEKVKCPASFVNPAENEEMQQRVRNRQETVNKRFKQWGILNSVYRHDISTHGDVFRAISVITQVAIKNGEPLFDVEYKDP